MHHDHIRPEEGRPVAQLIGMSPGLPASAAFRKELPKRIEPVRYHGRMLGEVVGGYRVTAKLGEGGMGVVYLAEHAIMGRKAVVKVLRPQLSDDRTMVQRFFNEARAAGAISHPGIVSVFDLGLRDDGSAFIIMDYLEGESLAQRLARVGRLPAAEALAITRQILSALCAAHSKGIVHRDLKPDNIFLAKDAELPTGERVKLLDFGIAKLHSDLGGSVVMTRAGAVMGTPIYMSPEQCRGAGECDQRADIYSVGVMLFELLTGRPPFIATTVGDLMAAHIRDAPPRLQERIGDTPEVLENIVAGFLAKSPDARYASGEVAIAQIDAAQDGDSLRSAVPTGSAGHDYLASRAVTDPLGATVPGASSIASGADHLQTIGKSGTTLRDSVSSVSTVGTRSPPGLRPLLWPALALLAVACALSIYFVLDKEEAAATAVLEVESDAALRAPLPAPDARSQLDAAAAKAPTPRADRLPAIQIVGIAEEQIRRGKRLHKRALDLHRAGDYQAAFAAYEAVLQTDPGHLMSRYDFACLLNLAGERHEGIAILRQLRAAGCPVCLGRLVRARSDSEWKSAWDDPAFLEVTQRIALEQPSAQESALQVREALAGESDATLDALIHPRSKLAVVVTPDACTGKACQERVSLLGSEAVLDWIHAQDQIDVGKPACRRECCTFASSSDALMQLDKVCTVVDSGSVRTISRLEFTRR